MSQAEEPTTPRPGNTFRIPSILSNSLRVVFGLFGEDIINLRARGSVHNDNPREIDELSEYGVTHRVQELQAIEVDYTLIDPEDPYNPLDDDAQLDILSEVDARLDDFATDHPPDLAVSRFAATVESEALMEASEARTQQFDLKFVSEPAIDPYRGRTQDLNRDRGLYRDLGFEVRNLNLHAVYETEQRYSGGRGDGKVMSWGGFEDLRPRARGSLMRAVYNEVLPDELGELKLYRVTDEEVVEPVADLGEDGEDDGNN